MLTKLEIAEKVVAQMSAQGWYHSRQFFPQYEMANCAYRGAAGAKCAAGALIPDEVYNPQMENVVIHELCSRYPAIRDLIGDYLNFVVSIQSAHDYSTSPDEMKRLMRVTFDEGGLDGAALIR